MATKPIQVNIATALTKIGSTNGTAIPEIAAPKGMSNADAIIFHDERAAIFEILVAGQVKSLAEKRDEKAKNHVKNLFASTITETLVSTTNTITRGDMALNVEKRKGRDMLDQALLMSALAKRGMDLDECQAIIKDSTKQTIPAVYLRASIITKE